MENIQVAPRAINELNKQIKNSTNENEVENLKVLLNVYQMFQEELNKLNK